MFAIINESPVEWLEKYGDYLFAFAFSRLRDEAVAEDLVQETLLAALQSKERFSNNSSEKTWLTAILKNKIIDHFRRISRQVTFVSDEEEIVSFDNIGGWREAPTDWHATPESLHQQKEFQAILQNCLADLPKNLAAVFTLREIEGLDSKEICEIMNLSPNNLWVMLHRARLQLRQSLQNRWFGRRQKKFVRTGELIFAN